MRWRIGEVTVTKIVELEVTGGSRFILPQATYEAVLPIGWLQPDFADERGRLKMSIHALVVETQNGKTGSRRIIVDTCLRNDKENRRIPTWNKLQTSFLGDLAAAGPAMKLAQSITLSPSKTRSLIEPLPQTASRNASPSRTTRPAVRPAKCVPMTSVGVPAKLVSIASRVRRAAAGSESAVEDHSGRAIWQGWCMKSPVISAVSPREEIRALT